MSQASYQIAKISDARRAAVTRDERNEDAVCVFMMVFQPPMGIQNTFVELCGITIKRKWEQDALLLGIMLFRSGGVAPSKSC